MVFMERTYSVLLVSASEKLNTTILPMLPPTDYWPVHVAGSVSEAQRKLLERAYDIVLINAPLPDDPGMRLAVNTCMSGSAGVLLLVRSELYNDVYAKVVSDGVLTLPKPTSAQMIAQSLRMLCATRERLRQMEEKQVSVEKKIEEIRYINRAKWLLIECLSMTEADAQRYIEKQAMDQRISKREAAENVIKTYGR